MFPPSFFYITSGTSDGIIFFWSTMKNKKIVLFISELGLRTLARHWDSSHKTPLDTGHDHIHDLYV